MQLFGGNGYMAEYEVEQLARDAKVLQIYAGTDEIQVTAVAKALLAEQAGSDLSPRFGDATHASRACITDRAAYGRCR